MIFTYGSLRVFPDRDKYIIRYGNSKGFLYFNGEKDLPQGFWQGDTLPKHKDSAIVVAAANILERIIENKPLSFAAQGRDKDIYQLVLSYIAVQTNQIEFEEPPYMEEYKDLIQEIDRKKLFSLFSNRQIKSHSLKL